MGHVVDLLRDFVKALCGREQRFAVAIDIPAPPDAVWPVVSARTISLPGEPAIRFTELPSPRPGDVDLVEVSIADYSYRVAFRVLDRREGRGELVELVPEHSDGIAAGMGVRRTGYGLEAIPAGTRLTMVNEGEGMGAFARFAALRSLRLLSMRLAAACATSAG